MDCSTASPSIKLTFSIAAAPHLGGQFYRAFKALALFTALASPLSAEEPLRLREALETARRDNPEIRAARSKWEAMRARVSQAATPDKPRLDFERMYAPRGENVITGAEERNVAVSQEIPFPTTLYFRGRAARKEAEGAFAEYQAKEREVLAQVRSAYAMLYLTRHSLHVFEENVALLRQFASIAESKYISGKAGQRDVLKARVELARMGNMQVNLAQEQETNRAMMNLLLNRPPDAPLGAPEDPNPAEFSWKWEELREAALENRPELRAAAASEEAAGAGLWAARSEFLPDIMMQYRQRNMKMGHDSHDAMLGLSLPLWFWKPGAMVREARAERDRSRVEHEALRNMTLYEVKNLFVRAQTAARLIELYRTSVLPQAEQSLRVTQAAYQSDRAGFLDLIEASRTVLDFRLESYAATAEYLRTLAELERAVGMDLAKEEG